MKLIFLEMDAKELTANKRIGDSLVDALNSIADSFARVTTPGKISYKSFYSDGTEKDDDISEDKEE